VSTGRSIHARAEHNTVADKRIEDGPRLRVRTRSNQRTPGRRPLPMSGVGPLRATLSALAIGSAMPRDGSIRLSDVETPFLDAVCAPCGRRGRYAVARLTVLGDTTINRRNGQ
jgi:hypothetical protein